MNLEVYTGSLEIQPLKLVLYSGPQKLRKLLPYIFITVGNEKFKTKPSKTKDDHPQWEEVFRINNVEEPSVTIEVYNHVMPGWNTQIGQAVFSMNELLPKSKIKHQVKLFKGMRPVGELELEITPGESIIPIQETRQMEPKKSKSGIFNFKRKSTYLQDEKKENNPRESGNSLNQNTFDVLMKPERDSIGTNNATEVQLEEREQSRKQSQLEIIDKISTTRQPKRYSSQSYM